jgi:nucleotide-binding universal stress UspA family protein
MASDGGGTPGRQHPIPRQHRPPWRTETKQAKPSAKRYRSAVPSGSLTTPTKRSSTRRRHGARGLAQPVHYRDVVVGNLVDTVATEATCDVLVERIEEPGPSESVLLTTAGGPHAACAAEIAGSLARANGASIEAIRVVPRDASEDDRAAAETTLDPVVEELPDVETATTVVESEEVITVITDRSRGHDFTLVGATHQRVLRQFVFGAVPEEVGRRAENTVTMPKRDLGITSRLRRRFGRG